MKNPFVEAQEQLYLDNVEKISHEATNVLNVGGSTSSSSGMVSSNEDLPAFKSSRKLDDSLGSGSSRTNMTSGNAGLLSNERTHLLHALHEDGNECSAPLPKKGKLCM